MEMPDIGNSDQTNDVMSVEAGEQTAKHSPEITLESSI